MVSNTTSFRDIENHWASLFIRALAQRRILNGYLDGTFRPDNPVSRGEFAAMMGAIINLPVKREYITFKDVPDNYWARNAIRRVYETGVMTGYPDQTFRPNDRVSRADVLVVIVNALGIA
ncbi:S-layer homology domain-containing protein, partial [Cylindrospermopsis raciborskii]